MPATESGTYSTNGSAGTVPYHAWRVGEEFIDASGAPVEFTPNSCAGSGDMVTRQGLDNCMRDQGIVSVAAKFQPLERFWSFQAIESGIFLSFVALLLGLGAWAVRRRLH
jgi:hypothetical protein